jgi:hypothetical protein
MKKITFLFAMIFSVALLQAQTEKPSTDDTDFKREIGIDMQGIFKGYQGSSLIYKVRDRKQSTTANYVKNCRYQLSMSGRLTLGSKTTLENSSSDVITKEKPSNTFFIHPQIGMERVRMFDRFGLYYGADTGPFYQNDGASYSVRYFKNPNNPNVDILARPYSTNTFGWSFTPFFGMKYKLNKRFSLAMETGFNVNYSFTQTTNYTVQGLQGVLSEKLEGKNQRHDVNTYMNFLRFLTFNYHF